MKKLLLLYNPISGKGSFKNRLDYIISKFQQNDYLVTPYRLDGERDIFKKIDVDDYNLIVAAGGDGTLNSVINDMVSNNVDLPLGIIPVGTSNDFAKHLGIKGSLDKNIEGIIKGQIKTIDIGYINGWGSFINVVSLGNLPSVAHKTNPSFKNNLGKLAYYINVLGQYPVFQPFKIHLKTKDREFNEEALLFFVLNSPCAGGFKSLAPEAKVDDGKFDVLVIKNCKLIEKLSLFIKVLKGEHHDDQCVLYFQTDQLIVHSADWVETDVDGEEGPNLPMEIKCYKKLKVFC
ncbi:YegS/Rv2252/BmrU family lipid kinase [Anaerobranca gottschalkii]|uniref:Lipid kinase, YegS/Rv2252/BmrU family n=1 Tax=Anaerobranca gottschalkii DSM 13577 TaxID=1120990 RepID=A0A1I0B0C0_9FIRM|nr:YegS/Rv2252/BmrU family lipid kinase [Anaerobranca gottschalkii]SES99943.1 lipid kinase, YegS/Rv2252/BmrU family [Anaerobranca gottschalkii DSM 13577]